jgi:acyl-CoA hydrolase
MTIDLSKYIRPGDGVTWGQACSEPLTLTEAFVAQRAAYTGARVFLGVNYAGVVQAAHADHLKLASYCGAGHNRKLADAGLLDICPFPYSQLAGLIESGRLKTDVVLVQVSPPNAKGEYSLGLSVEYLGSALKTARCVIAEVNDQVPWTHTTPLLKESDFAAIVHSSRPPVPLPYGAPGEVELAIGRNAAQFIPDRSVVEFGLGSLPDAILAALADRRDLGVHSGLLCDGVAKLMQSGAITNAHKSIDRGVTVGGVLFGTKLLFDFARNNPALALRATDYTHSAKVLGSLDNFVAVNSAVEVDLTGQVNAEIANGSYVGAVGGALDFIRAANASPGGASLICLPASIGTKLSRVVAKLSGPVATPRSEAGVFVTEHGVADLRGVPLAGRPAKMIAIAHPAFRESLEREAHAAGLLRG